MAKPEHFDVVVVGAGIASLGAAKAYMQCAPQTNLLIVDSNKTIGGVWCKENVYPGLRTNNLFPALQLPDYPFPDDLGARPGEHIPGESLHQYFVQYAEKFDLAQRVRYQTTALEAEKTEEGWKLLVKTKGEEYFLTTAKLIVGTGITSRAQNMRLKGDDTYNAPVLHAGALAREAPAIAKDPKVERVTVYGGSKFAWDTVYTFASAGKQIDWVIRKSGHGPTWIANIYAKLPILGEVWAERLVTTRFVQWFSPFPWVLDGSGWWRGFLQRTWLGRKIMSGFWDNMGHDMLTQSGLTNHPSLKGLWPDCGFFDIASSFAVFNYPTDVLDFVRSGQVKVYREDVSHLSDHTVHLADGTILPSDALVASTGWQWQPTLKFKDTHLHSDIGVPSADLTPSQKSFWNEWDTKADNHIMTSFPYLATRPVPPNQNETAKANPYAAPTTHDLEKQPDYSPLRLYRTIAPPSLSARGDRTLAFVGFGVNISHSLKAELTGLWIYAYFHDLLTIDPQHHLRDQTYYETSLMVRWSTRRHTYGWGQRFPDFMWDAVPWNDVLLGDLGLEGRRKGSWWRETFEPYEHEDYRGLVAEWLAKRRAGKEKSL
ncbi:hypothetical protein M409DRAFT_19981 [Zasmidium cellare ATCC 36951]|uniref:FAD/NAD(P)-binding domain-containing protein n=1 Tax=Zasmidium cellare ATCC 36951 TaxID=1080233 RepID=A0A6A6CTT3_ZASCE|nr:uncharacterized protein M409DRAFT_19981 [Zasmidium cellare ATCC 36951]KAF2169570.1 hypothetical protein M409DRAFT_19981 [Zasmidium cellare ATCC 36951]